MGSFNVAGSMSNISIGPGRKVVFIPLLPTRYMYNGEGDISIHPQTMIVSNDGAAAYFSPRFLPIVGEYNDYGTLENIERDNNVEYIEQYFKMSIDDFMSIVTCSMDLDFRERNKLGEKKAKELQSLSGMFEVYDVYKKMVQYTIEDDDAFESCQLTPHVLNMLGFKEQKEKTDDKRFSRKFIRPDIKEIEVHSDGSFARGFSVEKNDYFAAYNPRFFQEELSDMGIEIQELNDLKGVSHYSILFDEKLKEMKNEPNEIDEIMETVEKELLKDKQTPAEKVKEKLDKIRGLFEDQFALKNNAFLNRSAILPFYKMDYALDKRFKNQYIELLEFAKIMFCTNNFFFPAMNGEQDGNPKATRKLANVVIEFLNDDRRGEEY